MDKHCFNCEYCDFELDDNLEYNLVCENMLCDNYHIIDDDVCEYYKEVESIKEKKLHDKKSYELNEDINISKLLEIGFQEGGWISSVNSPKYYLNSMLLNPISIHIEVSLKDGVVSFDDNDNVYVIDENFCQPYTPFYEAETGFSFLNGVIDKYNQFMDELVKKGILKEKEVDKNLVKKYIK